LKLHWHQPHVKRRHTGSSEKLYQTFVEAAFNFDPNFNWTIFNQGTGLQNVDTVIVGQPEFLSALNKDLKKFPLETGRTT